MSNTKKITAERLQKARINAGYSLTGLSKAVDGKLIPSRISNYEQGIRAMSVEVGLLLSEALGISATYLLGLDHKPDDAFDSLSDDQKQLFRLLNKVQQQSQDDLLQVTRMIKAYLKK
ncbi:putative transcriptional regulator [uncultured Mediterranean phage uvMED]|nr:putative transcriptional regulator [uncultured Mediterranean phage uvMED]